MSQLDNDHHHTPKVSIGLPVFNGELFIRKALDSLLEQTFSDFELIISDNASTDSTQRICEKYAEIDTRIIYIRQPINKGIVANFKFTFSQARGEYFMWAAADDMWTKDCLMQWVSILDTDPSVALAFSHCTSFSHTTQWLQRHYIESSVGRTPEKRLLIRFLDPVPAIFYGMFRRSQLEATGIFNRDWFDWFDRYFAYVVASLGKIVVSGDFLFYSGVKSSKRTPYSFTNTSITIIPFFKETLHLINKSISLPYRSIFYILLTLRSIHMYCLTKRYKTDKLLLDSMRGSHFRKDNT